VAMVRLEILKMTWIYKPRGRTYTPRRCRGCATYERDSSPCGKTNGYSRRELHTKQMHVGEAHSRLKKLATPRQCSMLLHWALT
jgi:hypothetical protein